MILAKDLDENIDIFDIQIRVTDSSGQILEEKIKVDRNYKRKAPTSLNLTNNKIDEKLKKGSLVGKLWTTDADKVDKHSFEFIENYKFPDNKYFEIQENLLRTL